MIIQNLTNVADKINQGTEGTCGKSLVVLSYNVPTQIIFFSI